MIRTEALAFLAETAKELTTQDERITANPIFMVQHKVKVGPLPAGYGDHSEFVDLRADERQVWATRDEAVAAIFEREGFERGDHCEYEIDEILELQGVVEFGYRYEWHHVQPFLTEKAAKAHIECNGHNLGGRANCRVYVEGGFRNPEWEMMREAVVALGETPAVAIVRDGVNEDVAVVINGRKVVDCKNYETDHWVSAIVEALGGTYEEVVDVERLEGLLGVENG